MGFFDAFKEFGKIDFYTNPNSSYKRPSSDDVRNKLIDMQDWLSPYKISPPKQIRFDVYSISQLEESYIIPQSKLPEFERLNELFIEAAQSLKREIEVGPLRAGGMPHSHGDYYTYKSFFTRLEREYMMIIKGYEQLLKKIKIRK